MTFAPHILAATNGDIAEYRATRDFRASEIARVDSRFGVVQSDLHKGDLAEVICSGQFVYECSTEYSEGKLRPQGEPRSEA